MNHSDSACDMHPATTNNTTLSRSKLLFNQPNNYLATYTYLPNLFQVRELGHGSYHW